MIFKIGSIHWPWRASNPTLLHFFLKKYSDNILILINNIKENNNNNYKIKLHREGKWLITKKPERKSAIESSEAKWKASRSCPHVHAPAMATASPTVSISTFKTKLKIVKAHVSLSIFSNIKLRINILKLL